MNNSIGVCRICKRVVYMDDLIDCHSDDIDVLIDEDKVVQYGHDYLCVKHKGVKELF
jgi:hypothetical protein